MGIKGGPDIETDGLVFHLDAAAKNKSYPVNGLDVEYLVVSGGGAGGGGGGGGGAGGWIIGSTQTTIASGTYPIVIGAGGTGYASNTVGTDGGTSSVFGVSPSGGGGGARMYGDNARDGASGGGGNRQSLGGESVAGQGNNGGDGAQYTLSGWNVGGGGGGAGSVGMAAHVRGTNKAGSGGTGKYFGDKFSNTIGESGWLSGGGGGATQAGTQNGGLAGLGGGGYGGGNGSYAFRGPGQDGDANSGGGGGASNEGGGVFGKAGNGGSGIVLIRYKGSQKASGGDSIIKHRGYTVHVFTSSGNFVVGDRVGGTSRNKTVGELKNMGSGNYNSGNRGYWTFDGSNEHIEFIDSDNLSFTNAVFSLEVLFKYVEKTERDNSIIGKRNYGYNQREYNLFMYQPSTIPYLRFIITNQALNTNWTIVESSAITKNVWYHVIATSGGGIGKLYINGELNASNSSFHTVTTNGTSPLAIGCAFNGDAGPMQFFNGSIAMARVYNKTLSSSEVLDNYNATKGRFGL